MRFISSTRGRASWQNIANGGGGGGDSTFTDGGGGGGVFSGRKLAGYFTLPSIAHYLIVDPDQPLVIHHARGDAGTIATRVVRDGTIPLDPPGLELALADIYAA